MKDIHTYARIYGKKAPKKLLLSKTEPNLVIVRGLPLSGKAEYAYSLGIKDVIDTKAITERRIRNHKKTSQGSVAKIALYAMIDVLSNRRDCVVTGIFRSRYHYGTFMDAAYDLDVNNIIVVTMVGEFGEIPSFRKGELADIKRNFHI